MAENISLIHNRRQYNRVERHSAPVLGVGSVPGADSAVLDHIGELFETIATDAFYPRLLELLRSLADFNDFAIIIFRAGMLPSSPFSECEYHSAEACEAFIGGLYLQSPFYNYCIKGNRGFKLLREVAPQGFRDSPFYHDYMLPSRLRDEAAFSIPGDGSATYLVCLGRSNNMTRFSRGEARNLGRLANVIEQAILNHERLLTQSATQVVESCTTLGSLESKLFNSISKTLTEREREIVGYLIRGYSSKACARELDISPSTERVHRKNIYQKLGVNSQSALLANVFDRLFA